LLPRTLLQQHQLLSLQRHQYELQQLLLRLLVLLGGVAALGLLGHGVLLPVCGLIWGFVLLYQQHENHLHKDCSRHAGFSNICLTMRLNGKKD
jgi:hypothetical protein